MNKTIYEIVKKMDDKAKLCLMKTAFTFPDMLNKIDIEDLGSIVGCISYCHYGNDFISDLRNCAAKEVKFYLLDIIDDCKTFNHDFILNKLDDYRWYYVSDYTSLKFYDTKLEVKQAMVKDIMNDISFETCDWNFYRDAVNNICTSILW